MKALIVDDHPLIQQAVGNVLRALDSTVDVVVAGDCDAALELAGRGAQPNIVLLDLNLPGLSGIPALKRWRTRFPATAVIVLSALEDRQTIVAAMTAGAAGYIPKSSSNDVMREAVRLVLAGGKYLPPSLLTPAPVPPRTKRAIDSAAALGLTDRQLAVLRLIAKGASNKLICRELELAERTVKAHVSAVLRALNVGSRTQAAVEAMRLGLADAG